MLVLKRNVGQRVRVGPDLWVLVTDAGDGWARLAFDAPPATAIDREELLTAACPACGLAVKPTAACPGCRRGRASC